MGPDTLDTMISLAASYRLTGRTTEASHRALLPSDRDQKWGGIRHVGNEIDRFDLDRRPRVSPGPAVKGDFIPSGILARPRQRGPRGGGRRLFSVPPFTELGAILNRDFDFLSIRPVDPISAHGRLVIGFPGGGVQEMYLLAVAPYLDAFNPERIGRFPTHLNPAGKLNDAPNIKENAVENLLAVRQEGEVVAFVAWIMSVVPVLLKRCIVVKGQINEVRWGVG